MIAHLGLLGVLLGCKKPVAKTLSVQSDAGAPTGPLVAAPGQADSCTPAYPYPGTNALYLDTNPPASSSSNSSACAAKSAVLLSGAITDVPEFSESMAVSRPSPNYSSRTGRAIWNIVVHHTNGAASGAISTLRSPSQRVSAHLLVSRTGEVTRLVADEYSAWHALSANQTSLGVEIEAYRPGAEGLEAPQERMLLSVLQHWMKRYGVSQSRIKGHRTVVATLCPGWIWPQDADLSAWLTKATPFLK
jgi:hypothetical protein